MVLGFVTMFGCSLCCCMLFVSYVCVWGVVIFVLSVMRVVRVVPLWVACVICSLLMFVSDASGDHMVETYPSMALYVVRIVSLSFPYIVGESHLSICIVCVLCCCDFYGSLGSKVSPSIFRLMYMGSVMLSICSSNRVLYSAGSGVKRVHVVLSGLRVRLFV